MAENPQIVSFQGGELEIHGVKSKKRRESVLVLPLCRFLARVVRVPADQMENIKEYATVALNESSPFPDEELNVTCEFLRETDQFVYALAAALPESSSDDIAEALDILKVDVASVDVESLSILRGIWPQIACDGRSLVVIKESTGFSLFVIDEGTNLLAVRAVMNLSDFRREAMLVLLDAENLFGYAELKEVVLVGDYECEGAEVLAPVRRVSIAEDYDYTPQALERALDSSSLNAIPTSWQEVLEETRFTNKMKRYAAIFGGIWALIMLVLFGVPVVYGLMEDRVKGLCKEHSKMYREVKEMREKTNLVRKYSDYSRGALQMLKVVTEILPEGVELNSWNYRREEGIRFSGLADDAASVYKFKESLEILKSSAAEGDEAPALFPVVNLTGPSAGKGGKQRFDFDCRFTKGDEE
jgi:hypothetical protein